MASVSLQVSFFIEKNSPLCVWWINWSFCLADQVAEIVGEENRQINLTEKYINDQTDLYRTKLAQLENTKLSNVEKWLDGSIGEDFYLINRKKLDEEITQIQSELWQIESQFQIKAESTDYETNRFLKDIQRFAHESGVSREMLETFFDAIYVTDSEHIELKWKFTDIFVSLLVEAERRQKKTQKIAKEKMHRRNVGTC